MPSDTSNDASVFLVGFALPEQTATVNKSDTAIDRNASRVTEELEIVTMLTSTQ
jgi:hypothetical protein